MEITEYYRIRDKELNCYLADSYNTEDLNSVKRTILKFLLAPGNDIDDLSSLTIEQLLEIEGLELELEMSYDPFGIAELGKYTEEDAEIMIFPGAEVN